MTVQELCINCREGLMSLSSASAEKRNQALHAIAKALVENTDYIIEENKKDIDSAEANGVKKTMVDRLLLNPVRIKNISDAVIKVADMTDPIGKGDTWVVPNGLKISRIKVPLGIIGIIYEARPNVTVDAAALCIKSGNGAVLRGGKAAINSNKAIIGILKAALKSSGINGNVIQIIEDTSRESSTELMRANGYIDLLIPRGGKDLIQSVVKNATVPVIETGAGNCHIYVEGSADLNMALNILENAKMSRPSVCNAAEQLIVDRSVAAEFLPMVREKLANVRIKGDAAAISIIPGIEAASDEDYYTEYNDYILSIKVIEGTAEAVEWINTHSTSHSDAIITRSIEKADYFTQNIDSAAVYVNASTRFTDGEEFGFGAEIGISTQKLHARGPLGLDELTTVKYIVQGNGQIR